MTPEERIDAAELALGLLEGEERLAALERLMADPEFAAELAWWRSKFETLQDGYLPAEPSAALASRIEALIDAESGATPVATRTRRWPWLISGAVGGALAASLAAVMFTQPRPVPAPVIIERARPGPLLIVALAPSKGQQAVPIAAVVDLDTRTIRIAAADTPRDRVAELWRIGADGIPRSLGLLSASTSTRLPVRPAASPAAGETLAISIEPLGGSPTGAPTGPVVATGVLTRI